MKYQNIPYVDKPVSRILYGTSNPIMLAGGDAGAVLDAAVGHGITTMDTARVYGRAEESLGRWMEERGNRSSIVVLSKCGHHDTLTGRRRINEKEIRADFKTSAKALKTDYIDIYLLHRDDPDVPAGTIAEIFNALHAEGKIGAFGGSNWTCERIDSVNEYCYAHNLIPFSVSSPNFGLAEQLGDMWGGGSVTISGPGNAGARAWYAKNQMPVIAYSSLARGFFSGKMKSSEAAHAGRYLDDYAMKGYCSEANFERLRRCEELAEEKKCAVPQIAMAWLYAQKINVFAIVSTTNPGRMQENTASLELSLTEAEARWLDLETDSR
ncbi:MAG: aldo/keto reductase [Lachnospiraceae bacterium]|jgi:aryl-alcohol dehydrogenase-like predicted oxidoreductase|nr:aldo/keto reductase [Lachnospiraceae bacterium]